MSPAITHFINPSGYNFRVNTRSFQLARIESLQKWVYNVEEKKQGTNFVVQDDTEMTEVEKRINVDRDRGLYTKSGFPNEKLLTREISIPEMKRIALRIIGGRHWGGEFKCRHFAYNLVRSIVRKESLASLNHIGNWAENLRLLDEYYKKHVDGSYAFDICQKFDFNDWVKNHLDKHGKHQSVHLHPHSDIDKAATDDTVRNHVSAHNNEIPQVHHPHRVSPRG